MKKDILTPTSPDDLKKVKEKFKKFIKSHGGQILPTVNAREVIRFKGAQGKCIVICSKKNKLVWDKNAEEAWKSYKMGEKWLGTKKQKFLFHHIKNKKL